MESNEELINRLFREDEQIQALSKAKANIFNFIPKQMVFDASTKTYSEIIPDDWQEILEKIDQIIHLRMEQLVGKPKPITAGFHSAKPKFDFSMGSSHIVDLGLYPDTSKDIEEVESDRHTDPIKEDMEDDNPIEGIDY